MKIYKKLPFGGTVMGMSRDEIKPDCEKELDALYERIFYCEGLKIND